MKFKNYQNIKLKNYLKTYSLLIITNGINQNYKNQIFSKQEFKKLKLTYYKIYNKLTRKLFKNSRFKNMTQLIYSPIFFILPKQHNLNISVLNYLEKLLFLVMGIKLNKKIYSSVQLKNLKSINYKNEIALLYQFLLINLKLIQITDNNNFRNNVI